MLAKKYDINTASTALDILYTEDWLFPKFNRNGCFQIEF